MSSSSSQISKEEFNLFHSIDRRLFSVLIFVLGKDPNDATQVMALWLWLEKINLKSTIINAITSLPYATIDVLFMESMMCLQAAAYGPSAIAHIPVLISFLKAKKIYVSLAYFHENNTLVLEGVSRMIEQVCFRAFKDIVDQLEASKTAPLASHTGSTSSGSGPGFDLGPQTGAESTGYDDTADFGNDLFDDIEKEVYGKMGIMNINDEGKKEEGKESRGRGTNNKTLFLTFSKGYPIPKTEVREFFARYFGDVIEGLYMQEVGKNEQPLYARVVVRDVAMMDMVLQGQRKVKFNINGKHACVRKYVRRRSESPPTPPALD